MKVASYCVPPVARGSEVLHSLNFMPGLIDKAIKAIYVVSGSWPPAFKSICERLYGVVRALPNRDLTRSSVLSTMLGYGMSIAATAMAWYLSALGKVSILEQYIREYLSPFIVPGEGLNLAPFGRAATFTLKVNEKPDDVTNIELIKIGIDVARKLFTHPIDWVIANKWRLLKYRASRVTTVRASTLEDIGATEVLNESPLGISATLSLLHTLGYLEYRGVTLEELKQSLETKAPRLRSVFDRAWKAITVD